jgi:hypothetical protein
MMINLTPNLSVNSDQVAAVDIEHRHYFNGSTSHLVITLITGRAIRIEHGFGVDIYKLKEQLDAAT